MSKNKRERGHASLLGKNEDVFRCPLCFSPMKLVHVKSLICKNHHCYDLSRQGYVNMLPHGLQTKYHRRMFEARRMISRKGFFEPLMAKISELILDQSKFQEGRIKILDAGCGEGSLLSGIQKKITQNSALDPLGVGLDISKEGIYMAAKEYTSSLWCVGDLAKAPLASEQFHFILNVLTPANYAEFGRMLVPHGRVVKVLPEKNHLRELRDIFYEQAHKQRDSNRNTMDIFKNKFKLLDLERLRYRVTSDEPWMESLIQMTPLSWGTTEERRFKALEMDLREVTIDLTILVGGN
ncbi:putative RNA methyltransferase [Desulforamulus ruminis]|uniref:putative RNA methyltransferase n=1 Tax=Desulforamulus ruminis TaxID=1564 RepID=UPI0030811CB4